MVATAPGSLSRGPGFGAVALDRDVDLLLGTSWMRNGEDGWTSFVIDAEKDSPPDRNRLVTLR